MLFSLIAVTKICVIPINLKKICMWTIGWKISVYNMQFGCALKNFSE